MAEDIEIRPVDADGLPALARALGHAFGEAMGDEHVEQERHVIEYDRNFGAFEGDLPVGAAGAYSFRLTVPGGADIGAAGVTSVGVVPSHRRRGILRLLMARLFEQARERGEPVAILWASEGAIYQRFGYGMATLQTILEAPRDKIVFRRPVGPIGRVRIVEGDEAYALIPPIYEARRAQVPGTISRSEARWRTHVLADTPWTRSLGMKTMAVLEIDGQARAYVSYVVKHDWSETGPNNSVIVFELAGLDGVAEQAMWEWVCGIDLVQTINVWRGPVPHPLQLMVTEPRRLRAILNDGTWLRILDVPAALSARTYRGPGSLVLEVADDIEASNARRWALTVGEDGRATVAATDLAPDLALDIADLACAYLGAIGLGSLAAVGRVRERRPGALATADALFSTPIPPTNATMF